MGPIPSMRQLLRTLCHNTPWNYAVFWKLKHHRMLLAWEEGYCENSKPLLSVNMQRDVLFGGLQPYCGGKDADCEVPSGDTIELAVHNMACHLYSLGNGIVGTVAFTGKHRWVLATEYSSKSLPERPEEWQCQLAVGIKTIVLVPVLPHGVLQLGSLDLVAEDMTAVAHIKDLFNSIHNTAGSCTSFTSAGYVSPLTVPHIKKLSPSAGNSETCSEYDQSVKKDFLGPDVGQLDEKIQFNSVYTPSLPFTNLDSTSFSETDMHRMLRMGMDLSFDECSWEAMFNTILVPSPDSHCCGEPFVIDNSFVLDSKTSSSIPEDKLFRSSGCNDQNEGLFSELSTFLDSYNIEGNCERYRFCYQDELDQVIDNEASEAIKCKINNSASNSPKKCNVQESFRADLLNEHPDFLVDSPLGDFCVNNIETFGIEDFSLNSSSNIEIDELWANAAEVERLLETVIADICDVTDENSLNIARCARSSSLSDYSENNLGSFLTQKCEIDVLEADHLNHENHKKRGFPFSKDAFASSPSNSFSKDSSMLMNEEKPKRVMKSENCQMKTATHAGKRKPKFGVDHKPRPRDRQLIQDRVKELRELVPNAAKCSIDALLDRTIKHMLFLRSVSSQAEKLNKCMQPMADPNSNEDGFGPQGHINGATWAYELGSQPEPCPIIVENLDQQGHMLVEMMCTEYGDFLEIAQVMRRLDLTILKGVMESREEKLRAHFLVEGSKGFNRMEILWPLMQLLQQNRISLTTRF